MLLIFVAKSKVSAPHFPRNVTCLSPERFSFSIRGTYLPQAAVHLSEQNITRKKSNTSVALAWERQSATWAAAPAALLLVHLSGLEAQLCWKESCSFTSFTPTRHYQEESGFTPFPLWWRCEGVEMSIFECKGLYALQPWFLRGSFGSQIDLRNICIQR